MNNVKQSSSRRIKQLAIFGGEKVRSKPMPARKAFGDAEVGSLLEAIEYYRNSNVDPPYKGKYEQAFCAAFEDLMGGGYANAVSSGTGAVFVALEALQPPKGSEIIISPYVDAGPFNCILYQGCVPVVADTAPGSYNAGVQQFLDKVSTKTSVVIAVHSAGDVLDIERLVMEMHKRGIKVLEDCSQAPGAHSKGRRVGTFGDVSATSTMYRKTLMAGASGGIVYSQNIDIYRRALACADRGKPIWREDYDFRSPGGHLFPALNWNTDELSCAIGLASIRRLDQAIANRMRFVNSFGQLLAKSSDACRAYTLPDGASPFFLPVWVDESKLNCSKVDFARALQAEGIDLNPHYDFLVQDWPWTVSYVPGGIYTPNALSTKNRSFNLFLNEKYGEQEVNDTVTAVKKVESAYQK